MVMVLPITPFVGGDLWRLEKKREQTGFERVGRTLAAHAFCIRWQPETAWA